MRSKTMWKDIQNIADLQCWMYASPDNKIKVLNALNAELTLFMDDEGEVKALFNRAATTVPQHSSNKFRAAFNHAAAMAPPQYYDDKLSIPIWIGIIEQLQEQPAAHPEHFGSRWEEIKFELAALKTIN